MKRNILFKALAIVGFMAATSPLIAEEIEVYQGDSLALNADGSHFHVGDCQVSVVWEGDKIKNMIYDGSSIRGGSDIVGLYVDVAASERDAKKTRFFTKANDKYWQAKHGLRQFLYFYKKEIKIKLDDEGQPAAAAIFKDKDYAYCKFFENE